MNTERKIIDGFRSGSTRRTQRPFQPWAGLIGLLLVCASAQVVAQVCEAERQAANRYRETRRSNNWTRPPVGVGDLQKHVVGLFSQGFILHPTLNKGSNVTIGAVYPDAPNNIQGLKDWATSLERFLEKMDSPEKATEVREYICLILARKALLERSGPYASPSNARSGDAGNASGSANHAPALRPETVTYPELDVSAAVALTNKRQADVDRARQGKPKRHVLGVEAHNCLKPQPGGGVINECPYAVEYSYCVYRPTKDTWSASFDCEKGKSGSWQIGPGPNNRSVMHTAGETTYWFACKYGETLSKPDGISPADIEFQLGRGLLGRCAEWGSKQG